MLNYRVPIEEIYNILEDDGEFLFLQQTGGNDFYKMLKHLSTNERWKKYFTVSIILYNMHRAACLFVPQPIERLA